jgi:polyhydroxybutyrate depolymerase
VRPDRLLLALAGAIALTLSLGLTARAATSAPCSATETAGDHTVTLVVDGRSRTALIHVPPGVSGRAVPLLLALHGYGGSGPRMETYSGFSPIADHDGFVVAYPSSTGLYWNSTASAKLPNDVTFLGSLIGHLLKTMCLDPERVFAAGVSNGGGMVALAACELSSQLAGIASVAGAYNNQPPCRPARPVSVLEVHGTADQVVPYYGPRRRPTPDGMPPFVNGWVSRDRCSRGPLVHHVAKRTTSYRWGGCAGGSVVEHIRIRKGRHQWPGARPPDPGPPATICASCTIWSFFSSLSTASRAW